METGAIVGELANAIQNEVDDFFAGGVVTAGEVVSGILLSGDQLLRVEQLTVGASADFVNNGGLELRGILNTELNGMIRGKKLKNDKIKFRHRN